MKIMSLKPSTGYWMDIFYINLLKNCVVCLKRRKNKKDAKDGPFLNNREAKGQSKYQPTQSASQSFSPCLQYLMRDPSSKIVYFNHQKMLIHNP